MGLRVIETKRQHFEMACGTVRLEFRQICATSPDLAHRRCTVVFRPCGRSAQRLLQADDMRLPCPNVEVEVVLAIAHCRRSRCRGGLGHERRRSDRHNQRANKAEHISPSEGLKSCAALGRCHGFTRVKFMTQFVSHVFPSSTEKACSHCGASGEATVQMKRTTMSLSLYFSRS